MGNSTVGVQTHQKHVMAHDVEGHGLIRVSPKVESETEKIIQFICAFKKASYSS